MNIENYLKYLDVELQEKLTYVYLAKLQMQHMLKIPFENLDIHLNIPIILDKEYLFDKIITKNRGGFCYELNYLFYNLLIELGFEVSLLSCRFFHQNTQEFAPEFDHLSLLVNLNQLFLVDVGFGDSFRVPLPIPNGQIKDISGKYRVYYDNTDYFLQRLEDEEWLIQYKFSLIPRKIEEFSEMCIFHQTSPNTIFTQKKLCTVATPLGRVTLTDDNLTITYNRIKEKHLVLDCNDFNNKLQSHFGITLN